MAYAVLDTPAISGHRLRSRRLPAGGARSRRTRRVAASSSGTAVPFSRRVMFDERETPGTVGFAFHFGDHTFGRVERNGDRPPVWRPLPSTVLGPPPRDLRPRTIASPAAAREFTASGDQAPLSWRPVGEMRGRRLEGQRQEHELPCHTPQKPSEFRGPLGHPETVGSPRRAEMEPLIKRAFKSRAFGADRRFMRRPSNTLAAPCVPGGDLVGSRALQRLRTYRVRALEVTSLARRQTAPALRSCCPCASADGGASPAQGT